jgi:Periplasmic binding protein-like domain/Bacterial regulatory proteins, gntR family
MPRCQDGRKLRTGESAESDSWLPPEVFELARERLPKRRGLVGETVATLKDWIRTGVLKESLPGELPLKTRLRVGRDTLRLALKQLAQEGWISPAIKGSQRRIQARHPSVQNNPPTDNLPVTFLSPHPIEHRVTLLELEDTQLHLAEQGRSLRFVAPPIFHLKHPGQQLERLVRENPSAAWILFITGEAIQRWFVQRHIPAFLCELPFPGVSLPFVAADWEGAAFHAGIQLVRKGHQVIGILEYQERRPGLLEEERGLQRALATTANKGQLIVFKDDGSPASVARSLESAFRLKTRPTALVLTRAAQLLTCYSWLAAHGLRVPSDISIISLANDSWFKDLHPPVCFYQPDAKLMSRNIAERVRELVTTGGVTRKSLRVRLDYVPGASLGLATSGMNKQEIPSSYIMSVAGELPVPLSTTS